MNLGSQMRRIACWAVSCHLGLLSAALPLHADLTPAAEPVAKERKECLASEKSKKAPVRAYHYRKSLSGKRTSSGAPYNPHKLTAAHPTIPLGKRVKVVNVANQKSVVVTVNDRCRKHGLEFIDLSHAAARQLGFLGRGVAMVHILPAED